MKKGAILTVIVISALMLSFIAFPFPALAQNDLGIAKFNQSTSDEFVPGQVVVGLERADPNFHASVVARGGQVINTIDQINAHVIKVPVNSEDVFISSISHNPNVKYAERDVIMRATFTPDDTFFNIQWGMQRIGMESAWQTDQTLGSGVIVAVIDGGVYYDHPDLTGPRILTNLDRDLVDNDFDVRPTQLCDEKPDWHSTFVSGVVGATKHNSQGVAGVGPVDLLLVRVLDCGSGPSSVVADGILYATNNGADVINLSLGSNFPSTAIFDAVNVAHGNGAIIVASAGNDGSGRAHYPSGFANVISVSATDIGDNLASYSSFGDTVELTAPGGESGPCSTSGTTYIVSSAAFLDNNENVILGYLCAAGTSFSAPHVSGVAALLRDQYSQKDPIGNYIVTNEDIRSHLQTTAEDLGDPGWDRKFGYGLVRADLAVKTPIISESTPPATNNPPIAVDDSGSTDEDTVLNVPAPGVLENDSDPDLDPLTVSSSDSTSAKGASVTVGSDGSYNYDPTASSTLNALAVGESTTDTFSYTISDEKGGTDSATVTITVSGVNDSPTANDDFATTTVNNAVTIDVLSNDNDIDGDPLSYSNTFPITTTNGGIVTLNADNTLKYSPPTDFVSPPDDTFLYTITDGLASDSAAVTVTVNEPTTELTVTGINLDNGPRGSKSTYTITGTGFIDGLTVSMEGGSGPSPSVSVTGVSIDGTTIDVQISIKSGGPPRNSMWDVRVTNPDSTSAVLVDGFTVTP